MAAFFVLAVIGAFFAGSFGSEDAARGGEGFFDEFEDGMIADVMAGAVVLTIIGVAGFVICLVMGWRA